MSIMSFGSAAQQGPAQLAQSLAPAAGTAGSTAMSAARGYASSTAFRYFGLSMRFVVKFNAHDGSQSLGEWASCKGLKVDFKTETVKVGGDVGGERKLPAAISYSPIVLERAMELNSSYALQLWLAKMVSSWVDYDGRSNPRSGGTVDVTLNDVHGKAVAKWVLQNAYPVSWSGPALDAKQNAVALETLVLEHDGFLPPTAVEG